MMFAELPTSSREPSVREHLLPVTVGSEELQRAHVNRYNSRCGIAMAGSLGFVLTACLDALLMMGSSVTPLAIVVLVVSLVGTVSCSIAAQAFCTRRDGTAYVAGSTPIDQAVRSVVDLLGLYKSPGRTLEDLEKAGRSAADWLQKISYEPLRSIRRSGYHPMGDTWENEKLEVQWGMVQHALRELLTISEGHKVFVTRDIQNHIRHMVPPLRNILRRAGVMVTELEYGGYDPRMLEHPTRKQLKANASPAPERIPKTKKADKAVQTAQPESFAHDDLFTPVEADLNAAAALTVAMLRTQIATFRTADPSLFAGTDRQSGEALIDVHLPSLLRAFRTAHDASKGEERDEARMQFSKALGTVRNSLDQIMDRHAAEARSVLATEAIFLETRSGHGALDAS